MKAFHEHILLEYGTFQITNDNYWKHPRFSSDLSRIKKFPSKRVKLVYDPYLKGRKGIEPAVDKFDIGTEGPLLGYIQQSGNNKSGIVRFPDGNVYSVPFPRLIDSNLSVPKPVCRHRVVTTPTVICKHCGKEFSNTSPKEWMPKTKGGRFQRDHCTHCLWSLHLDKNHPGDREKWCGYKLDPEGPDCDDSNFVSNQLEPIGKTINNGIISIVYRCKGCSKTSIIKSAIDDNRDVIDRLPII